MIGKLLSFDLKAKVTVAMIHVRQPSGRSLVVQRSDCWRWPQPGFLKTEMTGGMKEHYEKGGGQLWPSVSVCDSELTPSIST